MTKKEEFQFILANIAKLSHKNQQLRKKGYNKSQRLCFSLREENIDVPIFETHEDIKTFFTCIMGKCKMCGNIFIRNTNQQFCGNIKTKGTCAFKNSRIDRRWGKIKPKVCLSCDKQYIPTGKNQKFCGSKSVKGTCSWNNQHNIVLSYANKKAPWLSGMTIKI